MSLNLRRAGIATAAVAALSLGAAPFAAAQSADLSGLTGSAGSTTAAEATDAPADDQGSSTGSLEGALTDGSKKCELPSLGGSVDAVLPYLGLSVPAFLTNSATTALDDVENPLTAAGIDVSELGLGSLEGPLCTVIFGGTMVESTETTAPTTTVTSSGVSGSDSSDSSAPTTSGSALGSLDLGSAKSSTTVVPTAK